MSTPTFEYERNGYVPELLEHYLRRFEELLGASQLAGVNTGHEEPAENSAMKVLRELAQYGGDSRVEVNPQLRYDSVTEIEQNFRSDSVRRIFNNEYQQGQNGTDDRIPELLRELQTRLEDLVRAVEQNTEQLSSQSQDGLELND